MFKLSSRSLEKLEGVNPLLVDTVKEAIKLSSVDFGVIYGVRSLAEQEKLYKAGRLAGILTVFGAPVVILVQLKVRTIDEGSSALSPT